MCLQGLDILDDKSLLQKYDQFLNDYESFLSWKETMESEGALMNNEFDEKSRESAKRFSDFLYTVATHSCIESELKKYLVL